MEAIALNSGEPEPPVIAVSSELEDRTPGAQPEQNFADVATTDEPQGEAESSSGFLGETMLDPFSGCAQSLPEPSSGFLEETVLDPIPGCTQSLPEPSSGFLDNWAASAATPSPLDSPPQPAESSSVHQLEQENDRLRGELLKLQRELDNAKSEVGSIPNEPFIKPRL